MKNNKKSLAIKIAKNLKLLRNKNGYTQEFVADKIEIHLTTYQRYECNNPPLIKLHILLEILDFYKVPLEALIK